MTTNERDDLIRAYAKGDVSWHALQRRGFADYLDVLAGLGELGLRPPIAEMVGPNVELRERGIAMLRERLQSVAPKHV